jgi:hypothetical protein
MNIKAEIEDRVGEFLTPQLKEHVIAIIDAYINELYRGGFISPLFQEPLSTFIKQVIHLDR